MTVTEKLLTNGAYGYPRGRARDHTPHILAVVHQTATTPYDGQAMALRNTRNRAGYVGNTATYYVDQDGDAVHAVDGTKYASWGSAPEKISYVDGSATMATVKRHFASGQNPNECVWEQIECVGKGTEPWSDAQFETAAAIIAERSKLSGLAITRATVVPHRDMNTVNRPSDPWPAAKREARMTRLIDRAKQIAGGEDVPDFKAFSTPKYVTVPENGWLYDNPGCDPSSGNTQINPGPRDMPVAGKLASGVLIVGYVDTTPTETELKTFYVKGLTPKDVAVDVPPDAAACKPFSDAAKVEGFNEGVAVGIVEGATTEQNRIADAEAARIRAI